jgi:hypothetical protein
VRAAALVPDRMLGNRYGHKRMLIASLLAFGAGSTSREPRRPDEAGDLNGVLPTLVLAVATMLLLVVVAGRPRQIPLVHWVMASGARRRHSPTLTAGAVDRVRQAASLWLGAIHWLTQSPLTCLVVTLRRFHALIAAIASTSAASCASS